MTSRRSLSSWKHLSFLTLAVALAACAGQGDIDRSQPDKIEKSMFFKADGTPKTFYYRQTYVGVPPTSAWAFEGMPTELMKVRFQITEKYLVGYRAHDYAPGSQNVFTGSGNNTDTPVLMFSIKSHFDVKREYNPGTGEQTNVISENTSDRPWDRRQYMRVDWSMNNSQIPEFAMSAPIGIPELEVKKLPLNWNISETDYKNPEFGDRPIITEHYLDFVHKVTATPDYLACMKLYPFVDEVGPWACGDAELKIRTSLLEVKPSSYEPLDYPDNYPVLDDHGDPVMTLAGGAYKCTPSALNGQYNTSDCSPAQVGAFSKFGFFRTVVQEYDRKYGTVEANRKYYANRWNIWENVYDANGNAIRPAAGQRKPKPIVYYTNVEFPDDEALFKEAEEVTNDWSEAVKKAAAGVIATEPSPDNILTPAALEAAAAKLPPMVVLKRNSCYLPAVKEYLKKPEHAAVAELVEESTGLEADQIEKPRLTQVCSIMEAATQSLPDGDPDKFSWQRNGDLRYSFFFWVDRPAAQGPLGYGPSSADPETGEIISASLYNYGAALDEYAQRAADSVELVNGDIATDDLLSGKTIADVLRETAQARTRRDAEAVPPEAMKRAVTMLRGGKPQGTSRLIPVPGGQQTSRLSLIKGTPLEREMMTPDILAVKLPMSRPGEQLSAADFEKASPVNWLSPTRNEDRLARFRSLSQGGCVFLGEFADDGIQGLALELKGKGYSGDELYREIRRLIFRGLADHEMGHTLGLRHNFAASTDALNYADRYWQIRTGLSEDKWAEARIGEYAYASVMDYGARFNSDIHGLGKYDHAAIRFGYGQLVDIMSPGARAVGATGRDLENVSFFFDYSNLPDIVGGVSNMKDGGVARYSAIRAAVADIYKNARPNERVNPTMPDRPYKFLSDEFVGSLDAKPWDFGANQREIIDDTIDRYKNYYLFNAFKRGRLNWSIDGYMNNVLLERYLSRFTEAYQYFYYYGDAYSDTDFGSDLLKASVDSLNAIGEILQTPEPGEHCPTELNPDLLVLPNPFGSGAGCMAGSTAMNIRLPQGKPYYINFSDDYYYRVTRAGSLYEKLAALIALTTTDARFYRVDTFADSSKYAINYYSVFKEEVIKLLSGVIRNDATSYGGYIPADGPLKGVYQPTPVVDLKTYGQVKPPVADYQKPGVKRVDTPVNKTIRYYALGLALSNLNSTWDSTLNFEHYLTVHLKGSKDDVQYAPGTAVVEYTHPQTGQVFRSPVLTNTHPGIGTEVIQELNALTGKPGTPGKIPRKYGLYKDEPFPDWYTAKAALDAAKKAGAENTDETMNAKLQQAYSEAEFVFQQVDYLVGYRVDLIDDIRLFRSILVP